MKCYTQTRLVPRTETTKAKGNCWQTCAAAILELPIEALPDQVDVEDAGWSFNNVLIAYLWKHHGKQLVVLHRWDLRAPIAVQDVYHIICGPSPRTATNGVNHCVVGRAGTAVWDVHPTRAGLIDTNEFQFIIDAASDAIAPRMDFAGRDCIYVAHEFFHATMAWARRTHASGAELTAAGEGTLDLDSLEERLARVHGDLVRQFVAGADRAGLYDRERGS